MAAKIKMLKLLQEMRGFANITNRRPKSRPSELVLAQMRPPVIQAAQPRRKLSVAMETEGCSNMPHPVRINHLRQDSDLGVRLPTS